MPDYEQRYGELAGKLAEATFKGEDTAALQAQLATLAGDATAAAEQEVDPNTAVTLWRFAALSAWQGGAAGTAQLAGILYSGTAACDRLAPPDFARPGDCLTIRMTPIRAYSDQAEAEIRGGSRDPAQVVQRFDRLESDFQRAGELGRRFSTSRIDPMQLRAVGSDMKRITCLARADLNLLSPIPKDLETRLDAMRAGLDPELQAAPCP